MSIDLEIIKIRYQEIQRACLNKWSDSCVANVTSLQPFILKIYQKLLLNKPKKEIFYYLWCIETEQFGLQGDVGKIENFIDEIFEIFSDQSKNSIKLTIAMVKKVFSDVIQEKITFEEASDWALKINKLDEMKRLEYCHEDFRKIFKGINFLMGIDLLSSPGIYQYSIDDVKYQCDQFYGSSF